jgi:hypothetical protein
MTACFWAGFRIGLRRNTCADRLKLNVFCFCGPPKQRPFFFGNAQANSKASSHLDEPSHPSSVPAINILRTYPIATDDRYANFSASTCPTQLLNLQQALQRQA